jgi:hypothetical protein
MRKKLALITLPPELVETERKEGAMLDLRFLLE